MDPVAIAQCEEWGVEKVRAYVDGFGPGVQAFDMREWLIRKDRAELAAKDAEQARIAAEALEAAKLSAQTSRDAAIASAQSAKWTMWAAIAAFTSVLITLVQAILAAAKPLI